MVGLKVTNQIVTELSYVADQCLNEMLLRTGIIDIGIEYCGTVCSQHHTFERIQGDPGGDLRGSREWGSKICAVG